METIKAYIQGNPWMIIGGVILLYIVLFLLSGKSSSKSTGSKEAYDFSNVLLWVAIIINSYLVIQFYWDSKSIIITSILMVVILGVEAYLYVKLCSLIDRRATNKQRPFVIVEENTLVMMVKGGDAYRCLLNMDGFVLTKRIGSQNEWGIIGVNEPVPQNFERTLPWKFRGKYWGGIFPDITVEEISIDRADWVNANSIEVSHEPKKVSGIRTQPERRINLKDLEIGDGNGAGVHLGIELLLRVKNPAKAVFERKGKFYQVIDAGTEQVFAAATLARKTDDFSKVAKTATGTKGLSDLYPQEEILNELNKNGFIQASGFEVVKFSVKGFEPNTGFAQLISAQRSVAVSEEEARVKANQVTARASEITTLAEAKSKSLESWLETAKKHGVDADVATETFKSAYAAESFTNPNSPVTVLVQEGATFGGLPGSTNNTQKTKKK